MSDEILKENNPSQSLPLASSDQIPKVEEPPPRTGKEIISPFPAKEKEDHSDSGGDRCCLESNEDVFDRDAEKDLQESFQRRKEIRKRHR